jgi:hypothetical protein
MRMKVDVNRHGTRVAVSYCHSERERSCNAVDEVREASFPSRINCGAGLSELSQRCFASLNMTALFVR